MMLCQIHKWINGYSWMTDDSESFPIKRIEEMNLSEEDMLAARKEMPSSTSLSSTSHIQNNYSLIRYVQDKTLERYKFSKYVMDPNRNKFSSVTVELQQ